MLLLTIALLFIFIKLIDFSLKKYTRYDETIYVPSLVGLNLSDTKDTLDGMDLKFVIIDSAAYNPDYNRGDVLSHQPKPDSEVKPGRKIYLTINPLTVHYIPLPDLKNKSLRHAISLLENNAFQVGDLYYIDHYAKDLVRFVKVNNEIVSKNDSLPKFTKVDLYLGDGHDEDAIVPNVVGLEFRQIKRKLNNHSLNVGPYYMVDTLVDTMRSIIYQQKPLSNEKVPLGTHVSVWLKDSLN